MKRILTFTVMILLSTFSIIHADPIDKNTALIVAKNWYNGRSVSSVTKGIKKTNKIVYKGVVVYYLIEYTSGGFIIVSGDDSTKPVLGYSEDTVLDFTTKNPVVNQWLENYKEYVYTNITLSKKAKSKITAIGWEKLRNSSAIQRITEVIPFTPEIKFNQGTGWNAQCPEDSDGRDGHALVGCVAAAMGQVLRYWEYPKTGAHSNTYNHSKYGEISANFGETTYDWDQMSKDIPDDENAKLLFHCGVSVNMFYGPEVSGAYTSTVTNALVKYFKYDPSAKFIYKYHYTDADWNALMKNELANSRPVLYRGRSSLTKPVGHLFVLDGYQITDLGDYFHINWGWGGRSNGYFYLTEMITHGGDHNWIENNAAIINLKPNDIGPKFVSTPSTLTKTNNIYTYNIKTYDANDDIIKIELVRAPSWISIVNIDGNYVLKGNPLANDEGIYDISIKASDLTNTSLQEFSLQVIKNNDIVDTKIIDFETKDFSQANFVFEGDSNWLINYNDGNYNAASGVLNNNSSSSLSITETFNKPSLIHFNLKVSSEKDYDFLIFSIDGIEIQKWSGSVNWKTVSFKIPKGEHKLSWVYKKDEYLEKGEDRAWIDQISYSKINESSIIDFETRDFSQDNFVFENNPPWDITSVDLEHGMSCKSLKIEDQTRTTMSIVKDFDFDTNIAFDIKVNSEKDKDYLIFFIDTKPVHKWSGNVDWHGVNFHIKAGSHTLSWVYEKDQSGASELDCAWIDNIEFDDSRIKFSKAVNNNLFATLNGNKKSVDLFQNYPNPASEKTIISFSLAESDTVFIEIIDSNGRVVSSIENKKFGKGRHAIPFDVSNLIHNLYFIRLITSDQIATKKMILN